MEDFANKCDGQTPEKKGKKGKKVGFILLSVFLAVLFFVGGGLTVWFSLDKQMRTLIKVKTAIDREYYKEVDDDLFYGEIFNAINSNVLDDYSWYMTEEQYAETKKERTGRRSGVGLTFRVKDENDQPQMLIVKVSGNSPAEEAGVLVGDKIVAFGKTAETLQESVDFNDFSAFLEEQADDSPFFINVVRGSENKLLSVCRSEFVENYVFYKTNEKSYSFTGKSADTLSERGTALPCLGQNTAYIRLTSFNGNAATTFKKAMEQFKADGKKNLLLDLRENGGGYMDILEKIASYFCKASSAKNPVICIADYGEKKEKFKASGNVYDEYFSKDSRVCVLADDGTASASEALIGCMFDYGTTPYADICLSYRGGVAKTFGKGIMQTTYPVVIGDGAIKLTTAELKWPVTEHSIHGRGILPEDGTKTITENYDGDKEIEEAVLKLYL
ncbi:MAG: hypothetical protein IJF64_00080 [Clostridia bacterium]|nr:hypothetical protein [Clostridia bacterium]